MYWLWLYPYYQEGATPTKNVKNMIRVEEISRSPCLKICFIFIEKIFKIFLLKVGTSYMLKLDLSMDLVLKHYLLCICKLL